jgi:hypothetical protein
MVESEARFANAAITANPSFRQAGVRRVHPIYGSYKIADQRGKHDALAAGARDPQESAYAVTHTKVNSAN